MAEYGYDIFPDGWWEGRCYEVSLLTLMDNKDLTLVHGICVGRGQIDGVEFGHAWLEDDEGYVYDCTVKEIIDAATYYSLGHVKYTHKYSYREALEEVCSTGVYGPWDDRILDERIAMKSAVKKEALVSTMILEKVADWLLDIMIQKFGVNIDWASAYWLAENLGSMIFQSSKEAERDAFEAGWKSAKVSVSSFEKTSSIFTDLVQLYYESGEDAVKREVVRGYRSEQMNWFIWDYLDDILGGAEGVWDTIRGELIKDIEEDIPNWDWSREGGLDEY